MCRLPPPGLAVVDQYGAPVLWANWVPPTQMS